MHDVRRFDPQYVPSSVVVPFAETGLTRGGGLFGYEVHVVREGI